MNKKSLSITNCEQFAKMRTTKPRRLVYGILKTADVPLTAKGIHEKINSSNSSSNIWLSSIYRALDIFEKNKIVSKTMTLKGETYYEFTKPNHSHYAVCTKCNKMIKLSKCPINNAALNINGFQVTEHNLEIRGVCKKCGISQPK